MNKIWENETVVCMQNKSLQYLQFKKLLEYPELKHCYTLKNDGKLNFPPIYKDENTYKQSCQKICDCLEIDLKQARIVKPHQTHTNKVKNVNQVETLEEIDGVITNKKDLVLLTTSADCISLLLYDPVKKVIGSIHSGWKGTLKQICVNSIKNMIQYYNSKPQDIICSICPSIRKCCFEVDEDVKNLFYTEYQNLEGIDKIIQKTHIKEEKQKYVIDTVAINIELLKQIGLKEQNIIDSNLCTVCHSDKFHSYRTDKELSGRNAALMSL